MHMHVSIRFTNENLKPTCKTARGKEGKSREKKKYEAYEDVGDAKNGGTLNQSRDNGTTNHESDCDR